MNIIVCVDDKFGISFMGRRVSRDRVVIDDIIKTIGDKKLFIHPDSSVLFSDCSDIVIPDKNYLDMAKSGDYCFAEKSDYENYAQNIESVIIYKWNRRYPADLFFMIPLIEQKEPTKTYKFKGNSHDIITKEVYQL